MVSFNTFSIGILFVCDSIDNCNGTASDMKYSMNQANIVPSFGTFINK